MKNFGKKERGRIQGVTGTAQNFPVPRIISGTGKATYFKFGLYIQRVHPNKSPLKISEKRERGRIRKLPKFSGTPYYLRNGESYRFKLGMYIQRVHPNKSP